MASDLAQCNTRCDLLSNTSIFPAFLQIITAATLSVLLLCVCVTGLRRRDTVTFHILTAAQVSAVIIIAILQMSKLRLKEAQKFSKATTDGGRP